MQMAVAVGRHDESQQVCDMAAEGGRRVLIGCEIGLRVIFTV